MAYLVVIALLFFFPARAGRRVQRRCASGRDRRRVAAGSVVLAVRVRLVDGQRTGLQRRRRHRHPTWINVVFFWMIQIPLAWWLALLQPGHTGVFWAVFIVGDRGRPVHLWLFGRGRWKSNRCRRAGLPYTRACSLPPAMRRVCSCPSCSPPPPAPTRRASISACSRWRAGPRIGCRRPGRTRRGRHLHPPARRLPGSLRGMPGPATCWAGQLRGDARGAAEATGDGQHSISLRHRPA